MSTHPSTQSPTRQQSPVVVDINTATPDPTTRTKQLTICWQISRRALAEQAPAGSSLAVNLELQISNDTHQWSLTDPDTTERIVLNASHQSKPMTITHPESFLCVESPALNCVVWAPTNKPAELLYVRTDIFKQLNLPGGRYTPATCTHITQ